MGMLLGDGIIVFAQILVAFQMVYEELYIAKYNVSERSDIPSFLIIGIVLNYLNPSNPL